MDHSRSATFVEGSGPKSVMVPYWPSESAVNVQKAAYALGCDPARSSEWYCDWK